MFDDWKKQDSENEVADVLNLEEKQGEAPLSELEFPAEFTEVEEPVEEIVDICFDEDSQVCESCECEDCQCPTEECCEEKSVPVENALTEQPMDLPLSQLSFNEQVIEKIASLAIREVDGVLSASGGGGFFNLKSNKGVDIAINDDKSVTVNLEVILEYGKSAPLVFKQLKEKVGSQIHSMTGLQVKDVNVKVSNVLTADEFNGKH